jgi:uncharacterized protein YbjT (DUF2867 family)
MGKIIVVVGATGKQGGATAARLLADGWRVRALTRDITGKAARALADAGAEPVAADLADRASLDRAMKGAYGVFSVQPAPHSPDSPPGYDTATEVRWGKNVADAAKAAGVAHLVYASLIEAERRSGVASFDSKWEVEQHIAAIGLPVTVLRPATFMDGFVSGEPVLTHVLDPDLRYQWIAVDDIGAFAALAFADPGEYLGRSLPIAGDELTPREVAALITRVTGRPVTYDRIPIEVIRRHDPNLAKVFEAEPVSAADIARLRESHPGLLSFESWLRG